MAAPARARPPPRGGRDARVDDVHLHGQDRHADPQRDDGGRGLDARRPRRDRRRRLRAGGRRPLRAAGGLRRPRGPRRRRPGGARSGRAVEDEGRWVAQGDPMEAALDVLARRVGIGRRRPTDAEAAPLPVRPAAAAHVGGRRRPRRREGRAGRDASRGARCRRGRGRGAPGPGLAGACGCSRSRPGISPARRSRPSADAAERDLDAARARRPARTRRARARRRRSPPAGERASGSPWSPATTPRPPGRSPREVGLLDAGGDELVVVGRDLPADEAVLGALLDRDGVVVARVSPEDKLRIARALAGAATSSR